MATLQGSLTASRILFLPETAKQEALEALVSAVTSSGGVPDGKTVLDAVMRREELMSTGIGLGIAVPHVRLDDVSEPIVAVGVVREGIRDYGSLDDQPVRIVVMVVAGSAQHAQYIRLLAEITGCLKSEETRRQILAAGEPDRVLEILAGDGA